MATLIIADLCINCGVCGAPDICPNGAITDGSDVGAEAYYIHPDQCDECVGFYDHERCASVCPVEGCIIPDPDRIEDEETLVQRALALHPDDEELKERIASGNFPSLKRKLPMTI
jgi:ferredoxin